MQYILTEKDNMWRGNIDLGNGETLSIVVTHEGIILITLAAKARTGSPIRSAPSA